MSSRIEIGPAEIATQNDDEREESKRESKSGRVAQQSIQPISHWANEMVPVSLSVATGWSPDIGWCP